MRDQREENKQKNTHQMMWALMSSVILGSVARRSRNDKKSSSDLNENLEISESAREIYLLELPPLGTKYKSVNFKPEHPAQKVAKIGKIAKISEREVSGEKFFQNQVSHFLIISHFVISIFVELDESAESKCASKTE